MLSYDFVFFKVSTKKYMNALQNICVPFVTTLCVYCVSVSAPFGVGSTAERERVTLNRYLTKNH